MVNISFNSVLQLQRKMSFETTCEKKLVEYVSRSFGHILIYYIKQTMCFTYHQKKIIELMKYNALSFVYVYMNTWTRIIVKLRALWALNMIR